MNSIGAHEFFQPGGSLGPGHPSYVEREADHLIYSALVRGECTCILNARQMGKTSLKNSAKERLAKRGILLVSVDLALIGGTLAPDQWYCSVLQEFNRSLEDLGIRTEKPVHAFWRENQHWAPAYRFARAVRDLLLPATLTAQATPPTNLPIPESAARSGDPGPSPIRLILAIDEIDKVRDFDGVWSDDFFGVIRAFYERREPDAQQRQVGFLLIGVAPPSELIKDANATPFNIGERIVLNDFTRAEARRLEEGFVLLGQTRAQAAELLDAVMAWTNGHPYLTQRLCYQATRMLSADVANRSRQRRRSAYQLVADACRECFLDAGVGSSSSDDNLRNVHLQLTKRLEDDRYVTSHLQDWTSRKPKPKKERVLADPKEQRQAAVLNLYTRVLRGKHVRDDYNSNPWVGYLHFSGVVRSDHGRLRIRNRIYQEVFTRQWVQENLPGSFRRAERAAFGKGIAIATAFGILVFVSGWQVLKERFDSHINEANQLVGAAQAALDRPDQVSSAVDSLKRAAPYYQNRKHLRDLFVHSLSLDSLETNRADEERTAVWKLWNDPRAALTNLTPTGVELTWVDISNDGQCVAGIYQEAGAGRLTVKRLDNGLALVSNVPCCQDGVAFDRSGARLAFVDASGIVHVVDTRDAQTQRTNSIGHPDNPLSSHRLQFNPDPERQWLALTSADRSEVLVWDLASRNAPMPCPPEVPLVVQDLAWNPKGTQLAALDRSSRIAVWDMGEGLTNASPRHFSVAKGNDLSSVIFLPRGLTMAGVGAQRLLSLWKADGWALKAVEANTAAGARLVSLSESTFGVVSTQLLNYWRFEPSPILRSVPIVMPRASGVVSFEMDPTGRSLAIAGPSWLTLVDCVEGKAARRPKLPGETMIVQQVQFTGDGDLVIVKEDGVLWWEHQIPGTPSKHGELLALPRARGVRAVAISPDHKQMALAHPSKGFQGPHIDLVSLDDSNLAAMPNPTEWRRWLGDKIEVPVPEGVDQLAFSPDGTVLLGHSSATAKLFGWSTTPGAVSNVFELPDTHEFALTPTGPWLLTASSHTIQCYTLQNGNLNRIPLFGFSSMHRTPLRPGFAIATLSPGRFLFAQPRGPDLIQLWELAPNDPDPAKDLTQLKVPGGFEVQALRLSPNGSLLAALAEDAQNYAVQLWDLETMNTRLVKDFQLPPMWVSLPRTPGPALASSEFRLDHPPKKLVERLNRTFDFEKLESQLRELQAYEGPDPGLLEEKPERTKELLNEIARNSRSLGDPRWEAHFGERARLLKETKGK